MSKSITTGECRLSFQKLTQPEESPKGGPKYSCLLMIPKSDTATLAALEACFKEALEEGAAKGKIPAKMAKAVERPWHDGDLRSDQYPEMEGFYTLNVSTYTKPTMVDRMRKPLAADDIYSGMWVRASINLFPFNFENTKKGVAGGLNGIQKLRDGEPFGGGGVCEFDELPEEEGSFLD